MNYATFDSKGVLQQRLIEGVHEIPESAVLIEDEDLWYRLHNENHGQWIRSKKGTIENHPAPAVQEPEPSEEWVKLLRQNAYRQESDPIKNEADYDALVSGVDPDYTEWAAKVAEIKARYPLPVVS